MNLSLSEQLAYSTVRIECKIRTGGTSTGTGFFFNFLEDKANNTHIPVVVTNKHVIKNASKGRLIITKANEQMEPQKEGRNCFIFHLQKTYCQPKSTKKNCVQLKMF
jgi:hypothetical protein